MKKRTWTLAFVFLLFTKNIFKQFQSNCKDIWQRNCSTIVMNVIINIFTRWLQSAPAHTFKFPHAPIERYCTISHLYHTCIILVLHLYRTCITIVPHLHHTIIQANCSSLLLHTSPQQCTFRDAKSNLNGTDAKLAPQKISTKFAVVVFECWRF